MTGEDKEQRDLPEFLCEQVDKQGLAQAQACRFSVLCSFHCSFLPPTGRPLVPPDLSVLVRKMGLNITLHFSAVGRVGPVAFFLTSLSLCGFCSEMTSALSIARVQGADGLGKENRGEMEKQGEGSSSQAHTASQWPSRARSPELSIYWQKCFFICKMGTILSTLRGGGN